MAGEDQVERTPPTAEQTTDQAAATPPAEPSAPAAPGFGERGRMRRRARFLRKARELAYRDLGGLVYDLHRFGQRNDQVVLAKLATLGHIDAELRAIEAALHEIKPVTVLHEVGIAACPRCAAIHGNEDRFCPGCGLAFAAGADRPLSTAPVTARAPVADGTTGPTSTATSPPTQTPPSIQTSPSAQTPAPGANARPAADPLTTIERPPAPTLKPTAAPVAARPAQQSTDGDGNSRREQTKPDDDHKADPEQQPTQVLRPPAGSP